VDDDLPVYELLELAFADEGWEEPGCTVRGMLLLLRANRRDQTHAWKDRLIG
jgi:hypothetical protein